MKKRFIVRLSAEEREQLEGIVNRGREAALRRRHAQVLLLVDEAEHGQGLIDREVAERVGCTRRTVEQIRERCVCEGLQAALDRKKRTRERARKLDGEGEAAVRHYSSVNRIISLDGDAGAGIVPRAGLEITGGSVQTSPLCSARLSSS